MIFNSVGGGHTWSPRSSSNVPHCWPEWFDHEWGQTLGLPQLIIIQMFYWWSEIRLIIWSVLENQLSIDYSCFNCWTVTGNIWVLFQPVQIIYRLYCRFRTLYIFLNYYLFSCTMWESKLMKLIILFSYNVIDYAVANWPIFSRRPSW